MPRLRVPAHDDAARWDSYFRRAGRAALATRAPMDNDAYFADGANALLELMEFVDAPRGGRALEIGCGDGRLTRTLVTLYESVIAQDVAPTVLDSCRKNLDHATNVEFVLGNVDVLGEYPDEIIDFVVSVTVMQHIPSRARVQSYIAEASRLLRPGGVAVLQLRDPSLKSRLRDIAVDLARLPTRLPSFERNWRGCRITEAEARAAAGSFDRVVEWRPFALFVWLVIRHTVPLPTGR